MDIFDNTVNKKTLTKLQLYITLILILFFSITGATYAYFAFTASNSTTINGETATVNLTLGVERIFPAASSTNSGVMVPQLSVSGSNNSPLASALKNGCVDSNENIICQVYKIDIQNNGGTATLVADGSVAFYGDAAMTQDASVNIPNLKWKLITSVDATTPANSVLGTNADLVADATDDNVFASDVVMPTNQSFTYYMIVWLNETGELQETDAGKPFYARITFDSTNGTGVTSAFTS